LFGDSGGKIFVFNAHVLGILHGGGKEMVFKVGTHKPGAFVGIRDGAVDDELRLKERGSW
jgi:hypothetical protein